MLSLIPKFLGAAGFGGFKNWVWIAAALIFAGLIFAAIRIVDNAVEDTIETSKEAGAQSAVIAGQKTTIQQIGDAHEASDKIRNDRGHARFCQCVSDAAKGFEGNCLRYFKDEPVPVDVEAATATCAKPKR